MKDTIKCSFLVLLLFSISNSFAMDTGKYPVFDPASGVLNIQQFYVKGSDQKFAADLQLDPATLTFRIVSAGLFNPAGLVSLTHAGFDFSEKEIPRDYNNLDGELIFWSPGAYPPGYTHDSSAWWRPEQRAGQDSSSKNYYIKDMGMVPLASVTSAPSSWPQVDSNTPVQPLMQGHVYVVQCKDGYAKFIVTRGPYKKTVGEYQEWAFDVDYVYSSTANFGN